MDLGLLYQGIFHLEKCSKILYKKSHHSIRIGGSVAYG